MNGSAVTADAARIDVTDLVLRSPPLRWVAGGRFPATGLDCMGYALLVLRRRWPAMPAVLADPAAARTAGDVAAWLAGTPAGWDHVGTCAWSATEAGDVLLTGGPDAPHVWVLDDARRRMASTVQQRRTGVVRAHADTVPFVVEVLRWRGPR